jgi:hypothetical protein
MEKYFLNRMKNVTLGMFTVGFMGIIIGGFSGVPPVIPLISLTIFLFPFVYGGLTLSVTKFESETDSPPKWLKMLIIAASAFCAVFIASVIGYGWYIYLLDINIPAENRHEYRLPGVYFLLVSVTVITMGRLIASKTKNPLVIMG